VRPHPPFSTNLIRTLEAPNRRAVISTICASDRSASPDTSEIVRRISALAASRSRAVANSLCSREFSWARASCRAIA
jgi:hypothetical protein